MKGIILAGGEGTRLRPCTLVVGKQLLPVYDKPMIYYPLSTLIHAGVKEVLIISTPEEEERFRNLLGDGSNFGITIQYQIQQSPSGIPEGITLARKFLDESDFWFILGDNLFHGPEFGVKLRNIHSNLGALIFAYRVKDPSSYGVVTFDSAGDKIINLEEKPKHSYSKWAIPGLYKLDHKAVNIAERLEPSGRGELEIMDLLGAYLQEQQLECIKISRGNSWFDLGTPDQLLNASLYVQMIQERQGLLVGSPEEASVRSNLLTIEDLRKKFENPVNKYSKMLLSSLEIND